MTCTQEKVGTATVVNLGGEVDSVSASELESRVLPLLEQGVKELLIDCTDLAYINSAGLRVFLLAAKQLAPDGMLSFCGLAPNVRLVFETIGFDRILTIHPDRTTALRVMSAAPSQAA
jgi:anti-anti-sigma factor